MMRNVSRCFSAFLLTLAAIALSAQNTVFEKITIEHGLSQGMIFDILQTRDGFLWVATKDGLNRYDGYNFKVFSNSPFDPFSITDNTVTALFEDSRGWLWVGTEAKGLELFEPRTGRFHHFPMNLQGNNSELGPGVTKILESPDGAIWALKRGAGLMSIRIPEAWKNEVPAEPNLEHLTQTQSFQFEGTGGEATATLHNFYLLKNGRFLATHLHGQLIFDPQTGDYQPVNEQLLPNYLNKMVLGDEAFGGDLWIGNQTELRRIRNNQATVFPFPKNFDFQWGAFSPGVKGHVWMVVNKQLWDIGPGEDFDFSKPDFTFDANPTCVLTDKNGNVWAGTVGYGLRKINPAKNLFHAGAAGVSTSGVWRDPLGRYYVKTRKSITNIFSYDPKTGNIAGSTAFPDAPSQHIGLAFEPSGATWLLSTTPAMGPSGSLRRYDSTGRFERGFIIEKMVYLTSPLWRSANGMLWVATGSCQLARFDPGAGQFEYFDFGHLFADNAGAVRVIALTEAPNGIFWAGTQLGLIKCTPKGQTFDFQLIKADPNNRWGLNNNSIACILPDPDGTLWLDTKGGGINHFYPQTGEVQHITTADGLLNNVVYGILPGANPNGRMDELWCSTNRGLAKIKMRPGKSPAFEITTFAATMGLQDNEFNTAAFFKADNGELLFGGVNGLNHFFPEALRPDTAPPPVYVVSLEINHKPARLPAPIESLQKLELAHDQNNLSFEFAALDFTDPSKNRYRYRLVGVENDWVEAGPQRFAHYSHLPPGNYELRVQGSNGESIWRDATPIYLQVNPPWWRSNLAYLCYVALLFWAGWRAYQFQIQRIKDREQLAFEHRETERVKALEQLKTNFFSNVTHEFRTPLTLIIEPLRQLLKNPNDPDRSEKIRLAEKNSRQLLALVNQLLDMAKLESGSMSLDLRRANLGDMARGVFERFLPLAEKRGVKLVFPPPPARLPEFDFDPGKVELVLNNLISNALKFTPEGGSVRLTVDGGRWTGDGGISPETLSVNRQPSTVVRVSDTGIGIAPENLTKIFDRFFQVDGSNTRAGEGTGIGLALSKELAELMGGGLSVESELGKGSTFTFWMPTERWTVDGGRWTADDGRQTAQELSAVHRQPSTVSRPPSTEKPVVLVIEDNAELRQFLKTSISENWQVIEASDGEEGVKRAIELVPDVVISDLMMPRKDGFALCNELKTNELTAHIPIVLLTAKSSIESKLSGLRHGADDYLTKPFSTDELLARIENLVETRRHLRQIFGKQTTMFAAGQEKLNEKPDEFLSEPDRQFLKKFVLLIEENLDNEQISIEDFSEKMFLSRSQLHRKIKATTDQSPTDFVRNYRLDRAHALLKNREGRVGEIALRVGFGSEKYFSTAFKEKFGVSPSQI